MEPMINNGDNRKEKRIISEPTPVDLLKLVEKKDPVHRDMLSRCQ